MDHTAALRQIAATYFEASLGLSVEQLLTPIASDNPAGKPMRGTREYSAIQHSRRADDASLPMGGWEHELKRADWHAVSRMAAQVLCVQSKDLACVAWLFEARLHIDGFAAIAPCLTLLDALLNQYWDNIHPLSDDGDLDSRANQSAGSPKNCCRCCARRRWRPARTTRNTAGRIGSRASAIHTSRCASTAPRSSSRAPSCGCSAKPWRPAASSTSCHCTVCCRRRCARSTCCA